MPAGEAAVGSGLSPGDHQLLVDVLAEVRGLRADLARRRGAPHDPAADARVMLAIATAMGSQAFTVTDLLTLARVDRDLRGALEAIGMRDARGLGARLRALRDRPVAGLILRRVDRDQGGTIWILNVSDLHTGRCASGSDPSG